MHIEWKIPVWKRWHTAWFQLLIYDIPDRQKYGKVKEKKNKCHEFGRREEWIKGAHRLFGVVKILHITIIVSMYHYTFDQHKMYSTPEQLITQTLDDDVISV